MAGGVRGDPLNFSVSENFILVGKFSSKSTKFGAENSSFSENLEQNRSCDHTQSPLPAKMFNCLSKLQLSAPTFLTHDAADTYSDSNAAHSVFIYNVDVRQPICIISDRWWSILSRQTDESLLS